MEREISVGAWLGIGLLILAALIGLGFGVFSIAKGVANDGSTNMQEGLGQVSNQVFLDYDQKVVSGQQVLTALSTFEGKAYAVLIGTKALNNNTGIYSERTSGGFVIDNDSTKAVHFMNYNALLAGASGNVKPTTNVEKGASSPTAGLKLIKMVNGKYIATNGLAYEKGELVFDLQTGGLFTAGNAEYLPTTSKYKANIIQDESGNNLGIVIQQQ